MKNYSFKNAIINILTNKRGHYYGLMIITAVLGYFGAIISTWGDTPERVLASSILALVVAGVQEARDYIDDTKK